MAHPPSMAFQVTIFWDGILLHTLQASSRLPHFAYMSMKLLPTKTSESYPLWMICSWAHLPSSSTTIQHPHRKTEFGRTPSCCNCQNSSSAFCPCPHSTCPNIMAAQVTKVCLLNTLHASSTLPHFEKASSGTLSKHPQCSHIFQKCQPSYSTQRHQTHNDFEWAVHNNCLPSSDPKPALGLITWRKVKIWELIPSHCSWWKSCINFSGCPSYTYIVSFWFRPKMFNWTVPGAIAAIFAATHSRLHQSPSQSSSCVFLCVKSWYLSFLWNQKSRSSWLAMYSSHPRHKWYHKNRESHTDLLHQHIAFTYFFSLLTLSHWVQRTWKEFSAKV
jgi:hypothetical protein